MSTLRAICVLKSESGVSGVISLSQAASGGPVTVKGQIKGLTPGDHGFHIHQFGDTTNGCITAGPHFNVDPSKHHGGPQKTMRHNGDLGNVVANSDGVADVNIVDSQISLIPGDPLDVKARSMIVHALKDDLGEGGDEESLKTGNAGGRIACGIIGLAKSD